VLGDALVNRLRHPFEKFHTSGTGFLKERMNDTESEGSGKFVVLHLRFDKVCSSNLSNDGQTFHIWIWELFWTILKELVAELDTFFWKV